ncbi:MAG: hypothetical protein A2286_03040 [Gammaproteobacteria bacterium RIFOXYA12_FULL_61_12]|nr:MAG: hypothetical protein A2286_03040 [Gammaproteobacteria bacterium RIFOXYA12_FULL_61_12]
MSNVENLLLEHLRAIRADISALREDGREIKQRLSGLETGVAGIRREMVGHYEDSTLLHNRVDRISERIERIERRLELQDSMT